MKHKGKKIKSLGHTITVIHLITLIYRNNNDYLYFGSCKDNPKYVILK